MSAGRTGSPLDELFGALADPTRRALLRRLIEKGPDTATRLAAGSPMTRQAVTKHLQALGEAGLARPEREGREVRWSATPEPLLEAVRWLAETSPRWDRRAQRLRGAARAKRARRDPPHGLPGARSG